MQYYHPDFFQELVLGLGLDWCKFVQNGKTLGQFFELLYLPQLAVQRIDVSDAQK